MHDWVSPLVTVLLAALSPILAWWGSTRYFTGRFEEQQKNTGDWRASVEKRLDEINGRLEQTSWAVVTSRLARAEQDITDLRGWKHKTVDPYIAAMDKINYRVDRLEHPR